MKFTLFRKFLVMTCVLFRAFVYFSQSIYFSLPNVVPLLCRNHFQIIIYFHDVQYTVMCLCTLIQISRIWSWYLNLNLNIFLCVSFSLIFCASILIPILNYLHFISIFHCVSLWKWYINYTQFLIEYGIFAYLYISDWIEWYIRWWVGWV